MANIDTSTDNGKRETWIEFLRRMALGVIGVRLNDDIGVRIRERWRRRISGPLLFVLYFVVGYIVIVSLAAYQIQNRVHQLGNEAGYSIWSTLRDASTIAEYRAEVGRRERDITSAQSDYERTLEEHGRAEAEYLAAERSLIIQLNRIEALLVSEGFELAETTDMAVRVAQAQAEFKSSSNPDEILRPLNAAWDEHFQTGIRIDRLISLVAAKQRTLSDRQEAHEHRQKEISKSIQSIKLKNPTIEDFAAQMKFFGSWSMFSSSGSAESSPVRQMLISLMNAGTNNDGQRPALFITLPPEVLVLIVVVAMGTLGSLIAITQVFFAGDARPITFYLFRPLFGAVVALGVYVVVKAGVSVATNVASTAASSVDGSVPLSPFFIAFVSLISGLMSESAIEAIRSAGRSFLRGYAEADQQRYGRGVVPAMEQQNKTVKQLERFFVVDKEVLQGWLSGRAPVPFAAQQIIAAWLEKDLRDLFSDIKAPTQHEGGSPP